MRDMESVSPPPKYGSAYGRPVVDHEVMFPAFAFVCNECGFIRLHAAMARFQSP